MAKKINKDFQKDQQQVLKISPNVIVRDNDDGTLSVLNLARHTEYYVVEGVAKDFWKLMNNKRTLSQICEKLAAEMSLSEKDLAVNAKKWMASLKDYQLLE